MSRTLLVKVAVLVGLLTLAWATAAVAEGPPPPEPSLPATPPSLGQSDSTIPPVTLDPATQAAFAKSCPGFSSASKSNQGWSCDGTPSAASAEAKNPRTAAATPEVHPQLVQRLKKQFTAVPAATTSRYHWLDTRTVYYGIGEKQIGSVLRSYNINMNGNQVQNGLYDAVMTGPSIKVYWAAGCRRYRNPDDRGDCGDRSGNADTFEKKYSDGWNFYPQFHGHSRMGVVFEQDWYAAGYRDPNGRNGAFPIPVVTSSYFGCPRTGCYFP